jgi:hypothetical protein
MTAEDIDMVQMDEPEEPGCLEETPKSLAGPHLFSTIKTGLHDGFFVDDLDWEQIAIRERFGIESMVALALKGSAQNYFDWVQQKEGVLLTDWEPIKLTLSQVWMTTSEQMASPGPQYSYRVWSWSDWGFDAVAVRPVEVFAIRHRSWTLLGQGRVREFYVAMQRSHMDARWSRANPGRDMEPDDMDGDAGFIVSGTPRGSLRRVRLTWPVADIGEVIRQAEALKKRRVADIVIFESGGVGFSFNKRTYQKWMQIAEHDRRWGSNGMLLELGRSVGMCD